MNTNTAQQVYEMKANGMTWRAITDALGLPNMNAARRLAARHMQAAGLAPAPSRPTTPRKRATAPAPRKPRTKPVHPALRRFKTETAEGYVIATEAARLWKMLAEHHKGRPLPKIDVDTRGMKVDGGLVWRRAGSRNGYADIYGGRIWLKGGCDWHTLAHELVHMAVRVRYNGNGRCSAHDDVFYYALKNLVETRFRVSINFSGVSRWGYDVDALIRRQCAAHDVHVVTKMRKAARAATAARAAEVTA